MSTKVQAAVLNSTGATSAGTIPLAAFGSNITAGNTIIAGFSWDRSTSAVINSVADGLGNTYTQLTNSPINDATSNQALGIWMANGFTTGGAATVTATLSVNAPFRSGCAIELSGAGILDVVGTATNHGTSSAAANGMSDNTVTPSAANATVIAVADIHGGATITAGTGWTQDTTSGTGGASVSIERLDQGAATLVTGQWTVGVIDNFNALVFSLKAVAGTTTSVTPVQTYGPRRTGQHSGPFAFLENRRQGAVPTAPTTVTVKRLPATGVG